MSIGGPALVTVGALLTIGMYTLTDWDAPPIETEQIGYRGIGMVQVSDPDDKAALEAANAAPEPPWELDTSGDQAQATSTRTFRCSAISRTISSTD